MRPSDVRILVVSLCFLTDIHDFGLGAPCERELLAVP